MGACPRCRRHADQPRAAGRASEGLRRIVHSGEQLLGLIENVLDLSRVEAGAATLACEPVDLDTLLREVCAALAPKAAARGLAFEVDIASDLPSAVETDRAKVRLVCMHLIGNALKFTLKGHVRAELRVRAQAQGSMELALDVTDTGPGIAPAAQASVFEAFGMDAAQRGQGGAGLGMALSRQFARLMGGDVTLQRTGPEGTVVRFTFVAAVPGRARKWSAAARLAPPSDQAAALEPIERALAVRLAELVEAGDALQFERCLAEELRDTHPVTYRHLLDLVHKFDYARILALLMPESA